MFCKIPFDVTISPECFRQGVTASVIIHTRDVSEAFMLNPLKPTGYVMHQLFNIQQLYVLPTLYLCVLYVSENKQRLVSLMS